MAARKAKETGTMSDEGQTAVLDEAPAQLGSEINVKTSGKRAARAAAKAEADGAKPKREKKVKEPKPARVPSEFAGMSQHQKNRRIAWAKYGPGGDYDPNARYVIERGLRAEIHAELLQGVIRPSANGNNFGSDRYLQGVAKHGWPEGAITILTGDAIADAKAARAQAAADKAIERKAAQEQARAEKAAAKEAAKAAKAAEAVEGAEAEEVGEFEEAPDAE